VNIGIVTAWFERGAGYVSKQYHDTLARENRVFIYARGGEAYGKGNPKWDFENVTWGQNHINGISLPISLPHFIDWLETYQIDLVLFNEQREYTPVLYCNKLGIITGTYVDYYSERSIRYFGCYDFLICNTRRHYDVFSWHPQCYFLPWGTDVDIFRPRGLKLRDPAVVTFFHSAGMNPYRKGTDLLIQSFAQLVIEAKLIIHTQKDIIRTFPKLRELIENLSVNGCLRIINKTIPAPGLYHLGDVYVYPSRLDGLGLTIAEALSCGLPVITTDSQPMKEFLDSSVGRLIEVDSYTRREDGYYWPQSLIDCDSLVQAIEYYSRHKSHLPQLKQRARDYAVNNLDWKKNSQPLNKIIQEIKPVNPRLKKRAELLALQSERTNLSLLLYRKLPSLYRVLLKMWAKMKLPQRQRFIHTNQ
jgi:glycosyltransferase involved in cell wall biosynthesis